MPLSTLHNQGHLVSEKELGKRYLGKRKSWLILWEGITSKIIGKESDRKQLGLSLRLREKNGEESRQAKMKRRLTQGRQNFPAKGHTK